jgi:hypothetical protein
VEDDIGTLSPQVFYHVMEAEVGLSQHVKLSSKRLIGFFPQIKRLQQILTKRFRAIMLPIFQFRFQRTYCIRFHPGAELLPQFCVGLVSPAYALE